MKQIASWASIHPELTHEDLAEFFNVTAPQVRYSLRKFAELSDLAQNTKKGKQMLSGLVSDIIDENSILESQIHKILTELEVDQDMPASSRVELLQQVMNVKEKFQKTQLAAHLRKPDAKIVAAIIRRFLPGASDEDIIKIFNEEKEKL